MTREDLIRQTMCLLGEALSDRLSESERTVRIQRALLPHVQALNWHPARRACCQSVPIELTADDLDALCVLASRAG